MLQNYGRTNADSTQRQNEEREEEPQKDPPGLVNCNLVTAEQVTDLVGIIQLEMNMREGGYRVEAKCSATVNNKGLLLQGRRRGIFHQGDLPSLT